jgi:precorrin-2/cobalt-factor-2 C20-methyltransferase
MKITGNNQHKAGHSDSQAAVSGKLIGVGVGPGDPGLVTMRAIELIEEAAVLAYPVHREGAGSRAFETVRRYVNGSTRLLPLVMPMTRDRNELQQAHAKASVALQEAAADGTDVVYLSIGDPLFYSTFGYLAESFAGSVEVVSGVSAMSAMAAALGQSIATGDIPTVVVAGSDQEAIAAALAINASIVIIKPRGLSIESLDALEAGGAFSRASAAVELGGEREEIITGIDRDAATQLPYFSILWIQPQKESQ